MAKKRENIETTNQDEKCRHPPQGDSRFEKDTFYEQ